VGDREILEMYNRIQSPKIHHKHTFFLWDKIFVGQVNQWGGFRLDPKESRRELFQRIFSLGIFLGHGGVSRYAATPLIVALSPCHSDITRFRPRSPIATGNHFDCAEKIPKFLRRLIRLTFLIRLQAFWDTLRGNLPHLEIFINDGPNSLTWDA